MIKVEQRTSKNAGRVFIGFDNLTSSKPFYVFEQDGEAFVSNTGDGSWYGDVMPTGKDLGRFLTLKEACAAYPDAEVNEEAQDAVDSGYFE